MVSIIRRFSDFLSKQSPNFKVLTVRRTGSSFLNRMTSSYVSLYVRSMGANPLELGYLSSIGNAVSAAISVPAGTLVDRYSVRRMMMFVMALESLAPLFFAAAQDWILLVPAMIFTSLTTYQALTYSIERVYIANSLQNVDRASGFAAEAFLQSLLGIAAPMTAALAVTYSGGINSEGIRPLFILQFMGLFVLAVYTFTKLQGTREVTLGSGRRGNGMLAGVREVFNGSSKLRFFLAAEALAGLSSGIRSPFMSVFAVEVKRVSPVIMGWMGIASTLSNMVFSLPVGRLADRIGRKKTLLLTRPVMHAAIWMSVLAPSPEWMILAQGLFGFPFESMVWNTWGMEMVPSEKRGRWSGLLVLTLMLSMIPAPVIGGWAWASYGLEWVMIISSAIDFALRIPLMLLIPETHGKG